MAANQPSTEKPGSQEATEPAKHLAFFVPSMRAGGAERVTLILAKEMVARGHTVDLLLAQKEGPNLANIDGSVRVVDLQASRVLASLPALVRYLRSVRPDALLSMMAHTNVTALWAWRLARVSTRVIVSERNTLSWRNKHTVTIHARFWPWFIRAFYPWADEVIAVSDGVADELSQIGRIHRDSVRTIYNPIVRPELREKAQENTKHRWFAQGAPPVVLAAGRLTAQKDFPTLIRAFARVRQHRDARLLIIGEGHERAALEALVAELRLEEDVSLPGFQANPYALMARAAVFVLSSRWEGLPGVLIEALSCGAPLIATDCPSGPREILKDGRFGHLVPIGDVSAMAEGIELALAGKIRPAPPESWQPFELDTVVDQYTQAMLPSGA